MIALLARASIDAALVVGVVWLLTRWLRLAAATTTVLWWCATAKFVLALIWIAPLRIPILPAPTPAALPAAVMPRQPVVAAGIDWPMVAASIWAVGLIALAAVAWRRWQRSARVLSGADAAPREVQDAAAALASRLGLRRAPVVRFSDDIDTPLVTGLIRPAVLLPRTAFAALAAAQQQMVLCHELAHVRRADLWFACVPALAERLFFFHPLVHLAAREYAVAREAACDAIVIETLDVAPRDYGRLLLDLGVARAPAGIAVAGAAWSLVNLKRRIAMLQPSNRSVVSRLVAVAAVGLAVAAMIPMRLVAQPASPPPPVPVPPVEQLRMTSPIDHDGVKHLLATTRAVTEIALEQAELAASASAPALELAAQVSHQPVVGDLSHVIEQVMKSVEHGLREAEEALRDVRESGEIERHLAHIPDFDRAHLHERFAEVAHHLRGLGHELSGELREHLKDVDKEMARLERHTRDLDLEDDIEALIERILKKTLGKIDR
jgi:beta-lactamase regulating signal transducer with metallopeptidase domain